ncbi:MAG: hypothetical protein E7590_03000 [Ruminococcaceae bacterium]|nr:hypothetical protein [Oscillospiraceae bacterium]
MKRILCIVLVLCALPFCLFSCKREDPFDFPETAETVYPIVEGRRIPFKVLFVSSASGACDHFVIRSLFEAKNALGWGVISSWWGEDIQIREAQQQMLLDVDYDMYQVIAVSVVVNPCGEPRGIRQVAELIEREGELVAVFDRSYAPESEDVINKMEDYATVMLVRKSDYDLENCTAPFGLRVTGYMCDKNDPTYIQPSV